jgi:microcystin degradation protein MlrC
MSKYIKGVRVWHITDATQKGKLFSPYGRAAELVVCGGFIPTAFAHADVPSADSDPVCQVCLKAPSDALKRSANATYRKLIPAPAAAKTTAVVANTAVAPAVAKKASSKSK